MQTREEARASGMAAAEEGAPLHDLTGHMNRLGVPAELRGAWMGGLESALEEQGFNIDGQEGDGYDWERRALSRI